MNYEQWEEQYRPVTNHLDPDASFHDGDGGLMFETYGQDYDHITDLASNGQANRIWTWVDGEDGTWIVSGLQFVNRIGYLVTEVPWEHDTQIQLDRYNEGVIV